MELAAELATDTHPGADFLRRNLTAVRRCISDGINSELLFVPTEFHEPQWQGMAGVVLACGCLHVQFLYVRPDYRNTETIFLLFKEIVATGRKAHYGYAMMYCPLIEQLNSLHDFCGSMAQTHADERVPCGAQVRIYSIPSRAFEAVL